MSNDANDPLQTSVRCICCSAGATSLRFIFGVLNIFLEAVLLGSFQRHQLDRQLVNRPGKPERWLVVIIVNPSAGIHADVEGLVDRLHKRNRAPMVVVLLIVCPLLWVVLAMLFAWSMNWLG
jgi:hypothetical protein